jgi:hypothetical protein
MSRFLESLVPIWPQIIRSIVVFLSTFSRTSIQDKVKSPHVLCQKVPWNGEMWEFYETWGSSRLRHWRDSKFRSWLGESDGVYVTRSWAIWCRGKHDVLQSNFGRNIGRPDSGFSPFTLYRPGKRHADTPITPLQPPSKSFPNFSFISHPPFAPIQFSISTELATFRFTSLTTNEPGAFGHKGPITCDIGYVSNADHATTCLMTYTAHWWQTQAVHMMSHL